MMVIAGSRKSATAVPSRMNSGFTHTPKPSPSRFPLVCSRAGITIFSAVPGRTVLRNTTRWNSGLFFRILPISRQTGSTWPRSSFPLRRLGVPTHRNEISVCSTAALESVVARSNDALCAWSTSSCMPGSTIGLRPESSCSTFNGLMSTPTTECPLEARHAAVTDPTYPRPKMLTRLLIDSDSMM